MRWVSGSRMDRARAVWAERVVKREGVDERRWRAEEAVVARRAGREAEKTKEAELMRCGKAKAGREGQLT